MVASDMDAFAVRERIAVGENLHTDYKERLPSNRDLAKAMVCFANADGGVILIGVRDDDHTVVGVDDPETVANGVDDVAYNRCHPPITPLIEVIDLNGIKVVAITVPKGAARPYRTSAGQHYIRSGSRCRPATREELLRLYQQTGDFHYDETPIYDATLDDLDLDAVDRHIDKIGRFELRETEIRGLLRNWRLYRHGHPTIAGIALFGRDPQSHVPHAKVVAATFPGEDTSASPIDRTDIGGRLFDVIEDCERYLALALRTEHRVRGFEPEKLPELPSAALREAVVNALAHRDYTVQGPVRLFILDDRIEIHTPGSLPNTVDEQAMRAGIHVIRNPHIYTRLFEAGFVTHAGTGVPRMIRLIRDAVGRDVELRVTEAEFLVRIPRKSESPD